MLLNGFCFLLTDTPIHYFYINYQCLDLTSTGKWPTMLHRLRHTALREIQNEMLPASCTAEYSHAINFGQIVHY